MSKVLETLVAELTALRSEVAALKVQAPAPARRAGSFRRIVGDYFKNPSGVMAFQNQLLDWNMTGFVLASGDSVHFDDDHLLKILNAEFATQDCWEIKPGLLQTIRRLHNEGKHGKDDRVPSVLSVAFPVDTIVSAPLDSDARRD